jgi:lysophospholipase L1-like esterase
LQKIGRRYRSFDAKGERFMEPLHRRRLVLGVFILLSLGQVHAQFTPFFNSNVVAQAQTPGTSPPQAAGADKAELSQLQAQLQAAQDKLNDWPNLGRYHDANAQVTTPAPDEERVVFMGDSITDGWGRKYGKFFPEKPYMNRGISGQTTPQMLIRFRPDVIALRPKVVVILAGTNDIAGNTGPTTLEAIEDNLASMSELARASGIRVVLASLLPVCDYIKPQTPRRPNEKIVALNAWMKDYAARNGFIYLDYYSAALDDNKMLKQDLTYDGLHPNDSGYAIMAPLAEKAIAAALHGPSPSVPGKSRASAPQKPAKRL